MIIHDESNERNTGETEIETAVLDIPEDLLGPQKADQEPVSPFQKALSLITQPKVYGLIIILILNFISFGLGRISALEEREEGIKITLEEDQSAAVINAIPSEEEVEKTISTLENQSGSVVASKSGTKYHYPWCSGAKRINDTNKVTFASIDEARAAGYLPASNCKGLK